MPSFLVLEIYLFLLLAGDGERTGWINFLHSSSVEYESNNYGVNNFVSMTTWRLSFLNGDIKKDPPRNNFLRTLLRFVVVRSDHDEALRRISFRSVFLILRWQKKKKKKTQGKISFPTLSVGMLAVVR
jgi:hypothetical protein